MAVDPDLVRAAQGGDAFAIDALIDGLHPLVRRICARVAPSQADDAAQEALLAVFRDLGALRTPEAIVTWASAVTARVAARVARTDRRQHGPDGAADAEPAVPPAAVDAVEVADALARLGERDHAVLVLRDVHGLSERAIAETLGVPVGTVKSRVHRARRRFREEWDR